MKKLTKYFTALMCALTLAACSMQKLAEKILPEAVQADAIKTVDAVLQKDALFFAKLQSEDMSDEDFAAAIENMLGYVSSGAEIRRDIVSASSQVNMSLGEGKNKAYNLTYEIQTGDGFTAIILDYAQTPQQSECCELINITVNNSETSPYRVTLENMAKVFKIVGLLVLLVIFLIVFFLVRHLRKKKAA